VGDGLGVTVSVGAVVAVGRMMGVEVAGITERAGVTTGAGCQHWQRSRRKGIQREHRIHKDRGDD